MAWTSRSRYVQQAIRHKEIREGKILIVDDEDASLRALGKLLRRSGYTSLAFTSDPRTVGDLFDEFNPDLVLLDLHMPHMDGFDVMEVVWPKIGEDDYVPILVLTADQDPRSRSRALSAGAKDFLEKPFEIDEVLLRIKNLIETRFLYLRLQDHNQDLERKVRDRTRALEETQAEILRRLARACEYRDDVTGHHAERVGLLAALVAREIGLSEEVVRLMRFAAPLHDVGKIGIPDAILMKAGKLTPAEFEVMKSHTNIGARILSGGRFPLLEIAREIALTHHERWDGSGYAGLKGESIPLVGRIVAVADVFDTLTHERPYKRASTLTRAVEIIESERGAHFDPVVVDAFLAVVEGGHIWELQLLEEGPMTALEGPGLGGVAFSA